MSYQADSLSLEEWAGARCKAVSALGSLTDCAHPESQLQDGGGPSDGAQLLNLNERLSPRALQSYFPECCPLLSVLMLDKATEPAEEGCFVLTLILGGITCQTVLIPPFLPPQVPINGF